MGAQMERGRGREVRIMKEKEKWEGERGEESEGKEMGVDDGWMGGWMERWVGDGQAGG